MYKGIIKNTTKMISFVDFSRKPGDECFFFLAESRKFNFRTPCVSWSFHWPNSGFDQHALQRASQGAPNGFPLSCSH